MRLSFRINERQKDENIRYAYELLIGYLPKNHCEIRYSALQVIDFLFQRSHLFREMILNEFQAFFELVLG
jgi:hypothetical protein